GLSGGKGVAHGRQSRGAGRFLSPIEVIATARPATDHDAGPGPAMSGSGARTWSAQERVTHSSPAMKASTRRRPSSSGSCTGGLFIRYDDAEMIGPPRPRSLAIFAARSASMMMPAEFGESQT